MDLTPAHRGRSGHRTRDVDDRAFGGPKYVGAPHRPAQPGQACRHGPDSKALASSAPRSTATARRIFHEQICRKTGFQCHLVHGRGRHDRWRNLLHARGGDRHCRCMGVAELRGGRVHCALCRLQLRQAGRILRGRRRRLHLSSEEPRTAVRRQPVLGPDRGLCAHQRGLRLHIRPVSGTCGRPGALVRPDGGDCHHRAVRRAESAGRGRGWRGRGVSCVVQADRAGRARGLGLGGVASAAALAGRARGRHRRGAVRRCLGIHGLRGLSVAHL